MTSTRTAPAISARAVRKSFGEHVVLDGVDLTVAEGTIFALLGPNGAGKTTMVRILSTLIRADAGDIRVGGHDVASDPDAVRAADRRHRPVLGRGQPARPAQENLQLMADLRHLGRDAGRRRVAELLERFELTDAAGKPLSTYSGGMRRRLDLAMTLVGEPESDLSRRTHRPVSTRAAAAPCGRSSASWSPTASRSFSPPNTSTRPTSSPTRSRCSTTAASSPRAPRPSSSAASPAGTSSSTSPSRRPAVRGRPAAATARPTSTS